jgi:hypothetical protein
LKSSTSVREIAEIETVLQNAADRVNRAPADCTYLDYVEAAVRSKGWKKEQASVTMSHYDPGTTPGILTPGTWAPDACPVEGRTDRLVQLVTITVTNPRATISRSIQVVKSDV